MRAQFRAVAQSGSVLVWGTSGRRFKSCPPDQTKKEDYPKGWSSFLFSGEDDHEKLVWVQGRGFEKPD